MHCYNVSSLPTTGWKAEEVNNKATMQCIFKNPSIHALPLADQQTLNQIKNNSLLIFNCP